MTNLHSLGACRRWAASLLSVLPAAAAPDSGRRHGRHFVSTPGQSSSGARSGWHPRFFLPVAGIFLSSLLNVGWPLPGRGAVTAGGDVVQARQELEELRRKTPQFRIVRLPGGAGETVLALGDSLTIEHLRGVDLDPDPPVLRGNVPRYQASQADDCPPGQRPYEARGIRPFQFRYFNCEFNYGGWHNFDLQDYAATHGFNILYPYVRTTNEIAHWPKHTRILHWGGFVDWQKWLPEHGLAEGRYDQLAGLDLVGQHLASGRFKRDRQSGKATALADCLMIDQEHPVLSPEKLRQQPWFPSTPAAQQAAERQYYDGYAQTYISSVLAARRCGWSNISIYGWYPYGRTWGGLEKVEAEPGTDQAWNAFGRKILEAVDVVNNSVYCFYWSPQNAAYTLANVDMNLKMVNAAPRPKPVRPYYWTLLHGGGGGWRWWREQPIATEEKRAMIAMGFFTGFDGFVTWNWSGTGTHHRPLLRSKAKKTAGPAGAGQLAADWEYHDVMVGREFQAEAERGGKETFRRYEVLHVLEMDEATGKVRFQKIRPGAKNHGVTDDQPVYAARERDLLACLRPKSEPVAAMIEGMALVKPFEYFLRHGQVKVDVPAPRQFGQTLPLVRRVKLGPWHVVITYDPKVIYGGAPRTITLEHFDGMPGRTLKLPADAQTRIWVLAE